MCMKPSIYWLFVFIPVTLMLEHVGKVSPPILFFSAALAIIPIAALIVLSTEQLATRTGDAVGVYAMIAILFYFLRWRNIN